MLLGWPLPERITRLEFKSLIHVLLKQRDSTDSDLDKLRKVGLCWLVQNFY